MTATAYAPRHAEVDPLAAHNEVDPRDPHDSYEIAEVAEVLRGMPLDPAALGDGSPSDWTLSVLCLLAGVGDTDAHDYIAPRVQEAAKVLLREVGWPGEAFQGA